MLIKLKMSIGGLLAAPAHFSCRDAREDFGAFEGLLKRQSDPLTATIMHSDSRERTLTVTGSFNGLLPRMANLDHAGILKTGRKLLKQAKKARIEPTMRMADVIQMTGMTKGDLEFFISLRLIEFSDPATDLLLSFRDIYCLMKIFSRFVAQGIIH